MPSPRTHLDRSCLHLNTAWAWTTPTTLPLLIAPRATAQTAPLANLVALVLWRGQLMSRHHGYLRKRRQRGRRQATKAKGRKVRKPIPSSQLLEEFGIDLNTIDFYLKLHIFV